MQAVRKCLVYCSVLRAKHSSLVIDAQQTFVSWELAKYSRRSLEFAPSRADFEFQVSPPPVRLMGR